MHIVSKLWSRVPKCHQFPAETLQRERRGTDVTLSLRQRAFNFLGTYDSSGTSVLSSLLARLLLTFVLLLEMTRSSVAPPSSAFLLRGSEVGRMGACLVDAFPFLAWYFAHEPAKLLVKVSDNFIRSRRGDLWLCASKDSQSNDGFSRHPIFERT